MNKTKMSIVISAALLIFASLAYCQGLTQQELGIYYDAAWEMLDAEYQMSINMYDDPEERVEARIQQFLDRNGITQEQLEDIINRGNMMPFTPEEEMLYQDLTISITEDLTPEEAMAVLRDLANEHGMSLGQVSSVFARAIASEDE